MNYIKIICMFLVSALLFTATGVAYVTGASSRPVVNTVSENTFSNGTLVPNSTLPLETTVVKPIENIEPVPAVVRGKRSIQEDIDDGDLAGMGQFVPYDINNEALNTIASALKKLVDSTALSKDQEHLRRSRAAREQSVKEQNNEETILDGLNQLGDGLEALDRNENMHELLLRTPSNALEKMELYTMFDKKCTSIKKHGRRIIRSIKRDMDVKGKLDVIPLTEEQNNQLEEMISGFKENIRKTKRMMRNGIKRLRKKTKENPFFRINDYGYKFAMPRAEDEPDHYNLRLYDSTVDFVEASSELLKGLETLKESGEFYEHLSDFVIYFFQDIHCLFTRLEAQMTYVHCKNGLLPKRLCPEDAELFLSLHE